MIEWLLLLLPVAAASGWWAAKRSLGCRNAAGAARDPAFFRGLNYLLDEQPDKAIDVFLKLAEVDGETAETHLALGSLFRRRGEVDRAIRIHQNLVARSNLDRQQRAYALYELGQDYMRAGLFDRAESLFGELVEMKLHRKRALEGLREIYQQEKDWVRCLDVAEQLESLTGEPMRTEIAQYHCELAEEALKAGDGEGASAHLRDAQSVDRRCVRATMLEARMETARGDAQQAVALYHRVADRGPQFVPEILPDLLEAYRRCGRTDLLSELRRLYSDHPSPQLTLTLADAIGQEEGGEAAIAFLTAYVAGHADLAGLERLLELDGERAPGDPQERAMHWAVSGVVRFLRERQPEYQCDHCGFVARRLHWQCPSCQHWGSIKPVQPEPVTVGADVVTARRTA
ncbi:MAG: lipopolysaccharide assembly protein LapB [Pseudomonadota bacterium]|nr:lipopolysaccharide assembly protein LapB [Pseudomonadota bacterium]